jgi:type I restriction-modification system DNA methylase subunit
MEQSNQDYLGEIYGEMELGGRGHGDYFTPYHVSLMNAKMLLGNLKEELKTKHYLRVGEPASGSGGMIIACRQVFIEQKCNPSWDMFVFAKDISALCFYMSYIQLSLYGLSAEVVHGDTLANTTWRSFYTPVAVRLPWAERFLFHSITNLEGDLKDETNRK